MKKVALLLSLSLILFGCDSDDEQPGLCLIGSGALNEYPVEVGEHIEYEIDGQLLEVGIKESIRCFETDFGITVEITVPDIQKVFVVGVSSVTSIGSLELDVIDIDVTGVAEVSLTGSANTQILDATGTLEVNNFEFVTDETRVNIGGVGDLEITCESTLDIFVSGTATIRYKGNPTITQNVTGSITLINSN
jgi:hypothetical protein